VPPATSGAVAGPTYGLLVKAMEQKGVAAIAKLIIRERENPVALISHDGALLVLQLRYPAQLRSVTDIPDLDKVPIAVAPPALELAGNLIDSMTKTFEEVSAGLVDRYETALKVMINDKVAGKIPEKRKDEPPPPSMDIMAALQASIAAAKNPTPAAVASEPAPEPTPEPEKKKKTASKRK